MKISQELKDKIQKLVSEAYYTGSDAGMEAGDTNTEYIIGDELIELLENNL